MNRSDVAEAQDPAILPNQECLPLIRSTDPQGLQTSTVAQERPRIPSTLDRASLHTIYEPLDVKLRQIRVLELLPGSGDDRISGILHVTNIPRTIVLTFQALLHYIGQAENDFLSKMRNQEASVSDLSRYLHQVSQGLERCVAGPCTFLIDSMREGTGHISLCDELDIRALKDVVQGLSLKGRTASDILDGAQSAYDLGIFDSVSWRHRCFANYLDSIVGMVNSFLDHAQSDGAVRSVQRAIDHSMEEFLNIFALMGDFTQEFPKASLPVYTSNLPLSPQSPSMSDSDSVESISSGQYVAFEAVSYCWDRFPSQSDLSLNGVATQAPNSAVAVLRNFRLESRSRILWIDAICIDQSNGREKSEQIPMMSDIYRAATCTLAWLGSTEDSEPIRDDFSMALCRGLGYKLAGSENDEAFLERYTAFNYHALRNSIESYLSGENTSRPADEGLYIEALALSNIFERRWFTRVWIYQEIINSKEIICHLGTTSAGWSSLMAVGEHILGHREFLKLYWGLARASSSEPTQTHSPNLETFLARMRYHEGRLHLKAGDPLRDIHLIDLAILSRDLGASDPRDKIFALLSMTLWPQYGKSLPERLRVDYTQSIRNCVCNATKAMVAETGTLLILDQTSAGFDSTPRSDAENQAWPSWCPRWDKTELPFDSFDPAHLFPRNLRANGALEADTEILTAYERITELNLRGFVADHLVECVTLETSATPQAKCYQTLEHLCRSITDQLEQKLQSPPGNWPPLQAWTKMFWELSSEHEESWQEWITYVDYQIRLVNTCFQTREGRLGLTRGSPLAGDTLAILFGGGSVYILRDRGEKHTFVAPSFMFDAMQGQLVQEWEQRGGESTIFTLV